MHSYATIYNVGHRAVQELFSGAQVPLIVQEKVDGSQFSFGTVMAGNPEGPDYGQALVLRSKGAEISPQTTDKLFRPAVETALRLFAEGKLMPGWTYRGETLAKPKHNTLQYARVPAGNVILFDVDMGEESYLSPAQLTAEAARLGLEAVPTFEATDSITSLEQLRGFLQRESCLGGTPVEGVVIKAYGRYGPDKKTLMAKYVSEAFKEVHGKDWRERNPTRGDVVERLVERYRTEARWRKAVQHLRELGALTDSPRDIGQLLIEVKADVLKEEAGAIATQLLDHFWPHIARGITAGLPQWYKDELAKAAFDAVAPAATE